MIRVPVGRAVERVTGGLQVVPRVGGSIMMTPIPDIRRCFGSRDAGVFARRLEARAT